MSKGGEATSQAGVDSLVRGMMRGFGGAIVFALPMLMTMEMWWLGFYVNRWRLILLIALMIPLLFGMARYIGFRSTSDWIEDAHDALIALLMGLLAAAVTLTVFNVVHLDLAPREIIGMITIQAVPTAFGALLGSSQLSSSGAEGQGDDDPVRERNPPWHQELFLMLVGALFLALNVAPTEEMLLIAFKMTPWHAIALMALTLALMHAFVYAADFKGGEEVPEDTPWWSIFMRYTVVGYLITLLVCAYILWTFGRYEDTAYTTMLMEAVVLGFPGGIGAAGARLLL